MTDSSIPDQLTPRAQARARTQQRILELGREHLATYGAAALSLRAIARDLDLVSSAVYRYVASRDDLLTLLVVDAYTELADRVLAAHATAPADDSREQLRLSCHAFRDWAVAEPARYALLYGSPVPGYQAPAEQTTEPGTRVVGLLVRTFAAADEHIVFAPPEDATPVLDFDSVTSEFDVQMSDDAMHAALALWAITVGLTSLEVFGQFGAEPPVDLSVLFTVQIDGLLGRLGLPAPR
ncbi:TetR/AcrR family transcriptional regulator [Williamsia soli]|uniref:TetR/AcrR family transcriptional regulator n=1 Tax=Williamsia soli TaxID=364929 RepID=UPI001A9ED442|nr:TetR/AcrR family transcriptional regulator [Williamsia soli]